MWVTVGSTRDTPTETMKIMLDTHQCKQDRKWSRSKHTSVPWKIPTTHSTKPRKTQRDVDCDGASRGLDTANMPADTQANQGVGKVPKLIPASQRDTPAKKLGKALSRMASRQNWVSDQASHSRKLQTPRPHSVHWWLSHQRPVRVVLHCQARCDHHQWWQCSLYSLNLQLDKALTHALC